MRFDQSLARLLSHGKKYLKAIFFASMIAVVGGRVLTDALTTSPYGNWNLVVDEVDGRIWALKSSWQKSHGHRPNGTLHLSLISGDVTSFTFDYPIDLDCQKNQYSMRTRINDGTWYEFDVLPILKLDFYLEYELVSGSNLLFNSHRLDFEVIDDCGNESVVVFELDGLSKVLADR